MNGSLHVFTYNTLANSESIYDFPSQICSRGHKYFRRVTVIKPDRRYRMCMADINS